MESDYPRLLKDHVVTVCSNGRRYFDPELRQAVIEEAVRGKLSLAALAMLHGVNANLLRRWVTAHQGRDQPVKVVCVKPADAFIAVPVPALPATLPIVQPVSRLNAILPNGVELRLDPANAEALSSIITVLGKLPCSASQPT